MSFLSAVAAIVLTGLSAAYPLPGIYIETNFAAGPVAGSGGAYQMVVLANKLPGGAAIADTEIYGPDSPDQLQTEDDMIRLAGAGSEAHRMFRRITKINNTTAVYWVFVTESTGAKATGTITLTNTATGGGYLRIWVGDEFVDVDIAKDDTPTVIATAAVASINQMTHWAAVAANTAGVITLTAKQKGLRGNWLRFQTQLITTVSGGIATTTSATADAFFTGGTTADSNATALATLLPKRYYYIVSAAEDGTQLGAASSMVSLQGLPTKGKRMRLFGGSVDTLANTMTLTTGVNSARAEVVWSEKNPWTPAELAANAAAIYAFTETKPKPRTSFVNFGNTEKTKALWLVPKSRVATAAPSELSLVAALNNGITPIAANSVGNSTYMVKRITTRCLAGSNYDYRIRDAHKVTICDFFGDDLQAKLQAFNEDNTIENDPPKGSPPKAGVAYPKDVKGQCFGLIEAYDANGLLQNVQEIKDGTKVQREASPTVRMGIYIPLQTCDNFEQAAVALAQVA